MKPKGLKPPFFWKDRRPLIHQGVLFVPHYYENHSEWQFPGWQDPEVFRKSGPICIEYCAGNGAWIAEKAQQEPDKLWVAVEKRFDRIRKIWSKKENLSLSNLFVVCGEALAFTKYYIPQNSVDAIYINFPDPWPKEKHAKHRLIQEPFVQEIARVAKSHAKMILVTDDAPYCEQMIFEIRKNPHWVSTLKEPYWTGEWPNYGTSFFDELWRNRGRQIHYLNYERNT